MQFTADPSVAVDYMVDDLELAAAVIEGLLAGTQVAS